MSRTAIPPPRTADTPTDMRYLESTIGYSIRRAEMAVFQHIYAHFEDRSLTLTDFSVMAVAADNPGITQAALALTLAVERPRIVPIINKLEEMGLAQRLVGADDKRSRCIVLSDAGKRRLNELKRRFARHEAELDTLLGEDKTALLQLLHRTNEALARVQGAKASTAAARPDALPRP